MIWNVQNRGQLLKNSWREKGLHGLCFFDQSSACVASPWLSGGSVSHLCISSVPHPLTTAWPRQSWCPTNLHFCLLCFTSWSCLGLLQLSPSSCCPGKTEEWAEVDLLSTEIGKTKTDIEERLSQKKRGSSMEQAQQSERTGSLHGVCALTVNFQKLSYL